MSGIDWSFGQFTIKVSVFLGRQGGMSNEKEDSPAGIKGKLRT